MITRDHGRRVSKAHLAAVVLAVLAFVGPSAWAQGVLPANTILVDPAAAPGPSVYATVQEGINAAVALSRSTRQRTAVWVASGVYNEALSVPADADLYMRGLPADRPWEVIIDGGGVAGGGGVLTIHTSNTLVPAFEYNPLVDPDENLGRLLVEGFTFRNGQYGVWVQGTGAAIPSYPNADPTDPPVRPIISRCVILGSNPSGTQVSQAGIMIQDNAAPFVVNCSIGGYQNQTTPSRYNSLVGVHVRPPGNPAADFFTDLLFCTIFMNENYGVYIENDATRVNQAANARVRNTIVYRNGDGLDPVAGFLAPEGGLVWESDLFITPNAARFDVPPPHPPAPPAVDPDAVRVTLSGQGLFVDPANPEGTRVYFGPPTGVGTRQDGAVTVPVTLWHADQPGDLLFTGEATGPQTLSAFVPASYLGAPGPVDVHIIRADGFEIVLRNGFTYVEGIAPATTSPPEVTQVVPEWGPTTPVGRQNLMDPTERRGNWVFVYGARFEKECEVWWDTNGAAGLQATGVNPDSQSERVIWLSSAKLYAKVPEWPTPTGKIDVFVRNLGSGLDDGGGTLKEYEYRDVPELPRPSITQVTPNIYRDLDGTAGAGRTVTVDIIGWNFGPGMREIPPDSGNWYPMPVIVKIGGIVCPYREIIREPVPPAPDRSDPNSANGIWQGENDINGDSFDEIRDVRVPVSEFGAGGSYDVEVINFDGQRDVLPNGFTYYADSAPRLDQSTDFVWRPANFASFQSGGIAERRLLARGLDTGLLIAYAANGIYTNNDISGRMQPVGDPPIGVQPDELQRQHAAHTQRVVHFRMPDSPLVEDAANETSALFRERFADEIRLVDMYIANVLTAQDIYHPLDLGRPRIETQFAWALDAPDPGAEARYFQIDSVTRVPDPDYARIDLTYWVDNMQISVEGEPEQIVVDRVENGNQVFFHLPDADSNGVPDLRDRGYVGPADVTVVLPRNTLNNPLDADLYWVAEDALWISRVDGDDNYAPPRAYAVAPRTSPDTGGQLLRVLGSDFIGPYAPANGWDYTRVSIYTQGGVPVPLICPADRATDPVLDAFLTSLGLLGPYPDAVAEYRVVSTTEIALVLVDLSAHPVFSVLAEFPRNTALDIRVEHVDADGVVLTDAAGNPLVFTLPEAIVLTDATALPPEITRVHRVDKEGFFDPPANTQPYPDQRWGVVTGGDLVAVEGANFSPGGSVPRVMFGGAEARVLPPGDYAHRDGETYTVPAGPDELYVLTPPAPQGLPGTVDVTVVSRQTIAGNDWLLEGRAPEDQRFTYIMDGPPVLTEIRPNFINRDETNPAEGDDPQDGVYFTIYGFNFDDIVDVEFDIDGDGNADMYGLEFFSVSPFEIVVRAPASDAQRPNQGLGLTDADYSNGLGSGIPGVVRIAEVRVRNRVEFGADVRVTSNGLPLFYYDPDLYDRPIEPRTPTLEFNDVHLNYRDYVNVKPGRGSISVDPLLDPGPTDIHTPGPRMIVAAPGDWWLGKLAVRSDTFDNPVRDKAGHFPRPPFTSEDLELDGRPNGPDANIHGTGPAGEALSEIGADELPYAAERLEWYYADVQPSPVGKLPAEALSIELRFRGLQASLNAPGVDPPPEQRVFIVPQGGDPLNENHRIPLRITQEMGGWTYMLTNPNPIDTVVFRPGGPPPAPGAWPRQGDIIADGHADICVDMPGAVSGIGRLLLGDNATDLSDGGVIVEQAVDGRHFLIDTIPPRIHVEVYPFEQIYPWSMVPYPAANPEDPTHNDVYFSSDVDLVGPSNHQFPLPPAYPFYGQYLLQYSPADAADPRNVAPMEYNGVIINPFRVAGNLEPGLAKPQIFFNVGSISNGLPQGDPAGNLDFDVVVRFIDPPAMEYPPAPYSDPLNYIVAGVSAGGPGGPLANNVDRFTGSDVREVSGFADAAFGSTTDLRLLEFGPAHWVFDEGRAIFDSALTSATSGIEGRFVAGADASAVVASILPGVIVSGDYKNNEGFVRTEPTTITYHQNNALDARWDITGLDWDVIRAAYESGREFHLAVRFRAEDRAGNVAEREFLLDPLHVWWMLQMQTKYEVSPGERSETNRPQFRWAPDRAFDPATYDGPRPGYIWRIYATSPTGPADENVYEGKYIPVTIWSPWSTNRQLDPLAFYDALRNAGWDVDNAEFWVLLVVLGCDEAGNVEPWPVVIPDGHPGAGLPLFDSPDVAVDFTVSAGGLGLRRSEWAVRLPNWQRFRWSGVPKPDTLVKPTYWYGDANGTLSEADGDVNLGSNPHIVIPPPDSARPNVEADFLIEGVYTGANQHLLRIVWELLEEGSRVRWGVSSSALERVEIYDGQPPFTLGDPNRRQVRHYVFRAAAFIDENSNGQYDQGERIDPTWANITFVVTPFHMDPKVDSDKQPIKSMEDL